MSEPLPNLGSMGPLAVIGGGSIGVSFAIVFARAEAEVRLYEPHAERRTAVGVEIVEKLEALHDAGLLEEAVGRVAARVTVLDSLAAAVDGAVMVQECVPEQIEVKRALWLALADVTDESCVLASSSSAILATHSSEGTGVADRCLVAHPGNPPHLIPVIEIVPGERTRSDIIDRARDIYVGSGLKPVVLSREVEGFIFNRLQGALLREAYALLRDGVAGVDEIDSVVRDGLGRRWSFMGPFETADLNTRGGIASHAEKLGPAYHRMGVERRQDDRWSPELIAEAVRQRRALLPLEDWEQRVSWRDQRLIEDLVSREARASGKAPEHQASQDYSDTRK